LPIGIAAAAGVYFRMTHLRSVRDLRASARQAQVKPFAARALFTGALSLVAVYVSSAIPAPITSVAAQGSPCLVTTANGAVQGVLRGGACAYLGVPYAAPPVGNLRWRPPQPRAPWAPVTLTATVAAPACSQFNLAGAAAGQEDCLTLNLWTPATRATSPGLPVLIFLHAGSFLAASSNLASMDGQRFAQERGAVVVAPNYRVGPFGFLAHSALTLEDTNYRSSGNYGLADQRAALRWVRQNIAVFGGDPETVTLAGTSAGSMSTSLHLVSPSSRGLLQRAIMQSGFATTQLYSAAEAEVRATRSRRLSGARIGPLCSPACDQRRAIRC
jgi:para-nitrobenzyl esterase